MQSPRPGLPLLCMALLLLLFSGCIREAEPSTQDLPPAPEPTYDLLVKAVSTSPETVYIGDNYTVRVFLQRYGQYAPSAYRVMVFDSDEAVFEGIISKPGLLHSLEFNYTEASDSPRDIRVYVESADPLLPEPALSLGNNFMQRTIHPQPLGYYGSCPSCMHWYYDSVNYVMHQAQAFNLTRPFHLHRAGLYLRSATESPGSAPVIVEIRRDNAGRPGEVAASSSIQGEGITREGGWHYAQFQNLTLPPGKYWMTARLDSTDSYGVQWARAEGNPYGEQYDTMVLDLIDWPEWDYKLFDFAFQLY